MSFFNKKNKGSVDGIIKTIESRTGCKVTSYQKSKKDFNDGSLDMPEPGMGSIQKVTPGYVINVKLDDGSRKVYHSDLSGNNLKEKV